MTHESYSDLVTLIFLSKSQSKDIVDTYGTRGVCGLDATCYPCYNFGMEEKFVQGIIGQFQGLEILNSIGNGVDALNSFVTANVYMLAVYTHYALISNSGGAAFYGWAQKTANEINSRVSYLTDYNLYVSTVDSLSTFVDFDYQKDTKSYYYAHGGKYICNKYFYNNCILSGYNGTCPSVSVLSCLVYNWLLLVLTLLQFFDVF